MQSHTLERNFFFALLGVVIVFTVAIFYPFLTVIVLGVAFSVVLGPIYKWIKLHITKKFDWLATLLTVILFLVIIGIPLIILGTVIIQQSHNIYQSVIAGGTAEPFIKSITELISRVLPHSATMDITGALSSGLSFFSNNIAGIFTSTVKTIAMFAIFVLTIFYALKDGEALKKGFMLLSPLKSETNEKILSKLALTVNGIIKGYFIIAIVQGILMGAGLAIFGIPNPVLWGVMAGIASLVPSIGTAFISVPAIVFLWVTGMHAHALGLLVWAGALVGMVDNLLSPFIIGKRTDIPPLFILFSVLGGVSLLGPVGILIGPLVISLLYTLISIYRSEANI